MRVGEAGEDDAMNDAEWFLPLLFVVLVRGTEEDVDQMRCLVNQLVGSVVNFDIELDDMTKDFYLILSEDKCATDEL